MDWSAIVESIGTEGDSCVKQKGEEEVETSEGGQETPSEIRDQIIIHFTNTVKLYQKKNWNCFRCGIPDQLVKDCPKDLTGSPEKWVLMKKKGWQRREAGPLRNPQLLKHHSWMRLPESKDIPNDPFLNPNSLNHWSGPKNIAWVWMDGKSSWALWDSGSTINVVTAEFVEVCSMDIGPLSNLSDGTLSINHFGGVFSWSLGYVTIRFQVEGFGAMMKIKWPWSYQIPLAFDLEYQSL